VYAAEPLSYTCESGFWFSKYKKTAVASCTVDGLWSVNGDVSMKNWPRCIREYHNTEFSIGWMKYSQLINQIFVYSISQLSLNTRKLELTAIITTLKSCLKVEKYHRTPTTATMAIHLRALIYEIRHSLHFVVFQLWFLIL
jgi:hypothetical protein